MRFAVAPHAGAWIEISREAVMPITFLSLPTRERGLKYVVYQIAYHFVDVAPHAGAWIEMQERTNYIRIGYKSLPTRERGLKFLAAGL